MFGLVHSIKYLSEALGLTNTEEGARDVDFYKQSTQGTLFENVRLGMFGAVSNMRCRSQKTTQIQFYTLFFLEFLQWTSLSFQPRDGFPWNAWVKTNVSPVLQATTLAAWSSGSNGAAVIICTGLAGYVTVCAGLLCQSAYFISADLKSEPPGIGTLSSMLYFLKGALFFPAAMAFVQCLVCIDNSALWNGCNSTSRVAEKFLGAFFGLLLFVLSIFVSMIMFDFIPMSLSYEAKAHNRIETIAIGLKSAAVVAVLTFPDTLSGIVVACLGVSSLVLCWMYYYFLPFYRRESNRAVVGFHAMVVWCNFCLVLEFFLGNSNEELALELGAVSNPTISSFLTFVVLCPVIYFTAGIMVDKRVRAIREKSTSGVDSGLLMEMVLRIKHPSTIVPWDTVVSEYREICQEQLPRSTYFLLHVALLLSHRGKNTLMARQYLRRALQQELQIDEGYIAFDFNFRQAKDSDEQETFLNFGAIELHKGESEKRITEGLEGVIKGLQQIGSSTCTEEKLVRHGEYFRKVVQKANSHLEELVRVSNGSSDALKLYGTFLENLMNNEYTANLMYQHAEERAENGLGMDVDLNSSASAVLDGAEDNLGVILEMSPKLGKMFGYSKDELVGKNIDTLCPPPFDRAHNMFLKRYLETYKSFVVQDRMVWGLHADGHAFPVNLRVSPSVNPNGEFVFNGSFSLKRDFAPRFIMLNNTGSILFGSKVAWSELLKMEASQQEDFNLTDFVPNNDLQKPSYHALLNSETTRHVMWGGDGYRVSSKKYSWKVVIKGDRWEADLTLLIFEEQVSAETVDESETKADLGAGGLESDGKIDNTEGESEIVSGGADSVDENDDGSMDAASATSSRQSHDDGGGSTARMRRGYSIKSGMGQATGPGALQREETYYPVRLNIAEQGEKKEKGAKGLRQFAPPERFGRPGSVAEDSSSMGSSVNSRRGHSSVFHLVEATVAKDAVRVNRYKWLCVVAVATCLGLSGMQWINRKSMYAIGLDAVEQTRNSMIRSFYVTDFGLRMNLLSSVQTDGNETEVPWTIIQTIHEEMFEELDFMLNVHQLVTKSSTSSELLDQLNKGRSVPLLLNDVDGSEETVDDDAVSLWIAVHTFAGRIKSVIERPKLRKGCDEDCQFIVANGIGPIFNASSTAGELYAKETELVLTNVHTMNLQNFIVAIVVSFVAVCVFILPSVLKERKAQIKLAESLTRIPSHVTKELIEITKDRLKSISGLFSPDELDDKYDGANSEKGGQSETQATVRGNERPESLSNSFGEKKERKQLRKVGGNKRVDPEGDFFTKSRPIMNKESPIGIFLRAFRKSIFPLGLPYIVTLMYFGVVTGVEVILLEDRIAKSHRAYTAGFRWVAAHNLNSLIETGLGDANIPSWSEYSGKADEKFEIMLDRLHDVVNSHDYLLYGNASEGVKPIIDRSGNEAVFDNLFVDACHGHCEEYPNEKLSHSLRTGLHNGLMFFIEEALTIYHESKEHNANQWMNKTRALSEKLELAHVMSDAFEYALNIYVDDFNNLLTQQLFAGKVMLVMYIFTLIFSGVLTFQLFKKQHETIQSLQYLFLFFPMQVLKTVPEIREILFKESTDASNRGSHLS